MAASSEGASLPRPLAALIEYFWLSSSAKLAPASAEDRRALSDALAAIRDRAAAAVLLWSEGHGDSALDELLRAEALYQALASGPLASVTALARGYAPPTEDAQRTVSTFDARLASLERALDQLDGARHSPLGRWFTRGSRTLSLVALIALVALGASAWRGRAPMQSTASSSWGTTYFHDRAVDRDFTTSWLLPDYALGWIRLGFSSRSVRTVRLFNVRRLPSYGTRRATLELYDGARVVSTQELDLQGSVGRMEPHVVRLPSSVRADALKLTVREYHGIGGGFAEIEVE